MSRLRLWLSLLALGFGFWTVGQLVTLRILHRSYQTSRHFIADIQPESTPSRRVSAIKVKIYQESGISIAEITSEDPTLLEREFQFTVVTPKDIEQAISKELQIPVKEVRSLIYYRVLTR